MLESTYKSCLCFELPILYNGRRIDCGYRLDLLVSTTTRS